jgi:hypothetical protein
MKRIYLLIASTVMSVSAFAQFEIKDKVYLSADKQGIGVIKGFKENNTLADVLVYSKTRLPEMATYSVSGLRFCDIKCEQELNFTILTYLLTKTLDYKADSILNKSKLSSVEKMNELQQLSPIRKALID